VKYLNVPGNNLPAESPRPGYPPSVANSALSHADPTELNLAKYFSILRKNLWVIAGIVMCSTLVAVIASVKSPKIFEAITKINVDRETPQYVSFKDVVNDSFDYEMFIETQQRILLSNTLALTTIDGMKLASNQGFVGKQAGPPPDASRPRTDRETFSLIQRFLGDLRVQRIRGSQIVEIHFMCYDAALAAKIADQLSENYIEHNLQSKVDSTKRAQEWLQGQLDELRVKVEKSEEAQVAYERANSILMLDDKQDHSITKDRLEDANKQLITAEAERRSAEARWHVLQQQGAAGLLQESAALSSLQLKLNEANQAFEEAARQYGDNHPKYIKAKLQRDMAQTDLDRETKHETAQVQAAYQLTVEKEQGIRKLFTDAKAEAEAQSNKLIEYNILKRDVDSYRELYNSMQSRLKAATVESGLNSSNIQIIDRAQVPLVPTLPRTGQNISLGIVVGMMLGLAASFLRDFLDNTVKTPDDVEQMAGLPNLGVIPGISPGLVRAAYYAGYGLGKSKHKELAPGETEEVRDKDSKSIVGLCRPETVTLSHPHSSIAESFRALRTALLLANSGMPPRTILVTSGLPSEGKTTIAINVAITLAQRGGRVLLVDGDLRRPSVHRHLLGTRKARDEMPGLSHFLTGNASLAEAIQPSGIISNMDVMMAGSIPPNPAELCSSEPMRKLLHDLREDYSHVIIDSPPLLSVTDSTILSVQTDGVLLVSRSGFSTRDSLRRAKKLLEHVNARLLGVVLNDLNLAVDGYYYYYYYGYYGYGRPDREAAHVPGN
jgi:succinoglycan biosynthesis transport protein ExoP